MHTLHIEMLLQLWHFGFEHSTLSTAISLCNTISEQGLEGKHPWNSVSNTNHELTLLFRCDMNSVSNIINL